MKLTQPAIILLCLLQRKWGKKKALSFPFCIAERNTDLYTMKFHV